MVKKRQTTVQIISKLREADVELGKGLKVPDVCKQMGVSEQTYPARRKMLRWNRSTARFVTNCSIASCS